MDSLSYDLTAAGELGIREAGLRIHQSLKSRKTGVAGSAMSGSIEKGLAVAWPRCNVWISRLGIESEFERARALL